MTTKLIDNRDLALKIGYAATDWADPISYDDYEEIAKDWRIVAMIRDDEPIGAVYYKDGETHVSVLPKWRRRWATRGLLKQIMDDTKFTRVDVGHDFMYGILERLGFRREQDGTLTLVREN